MERRAFTALVAALVLAGCGGGGGGNAIAQGPGQPSSPAAKLSRNIAAWGDSHTSGLPDKPDLVPGYAVKLRELVSDRQVFDGGVAGQTSTEIADRETQDTEHDGWVTVFWYGGNNETESERIKADLARSIASLAPGNDRYVVMAVVNSSAPWERRGTPDYQTILQLNEDLAATYPNNFLDIRSYIVGLYDPSSQMDVWDHQADIPPTSLRADGVHLNDAGYEAVARRVLEYIQAKGW